jgi:predicted amidohydrolase
MKVAAYQMSLPACRSHDSILRIAATVRWCEANRIQVLCCPEGALGGLADYAPAAADIAVRVENGELLTLIAPLLSRSVTTIVGFTELGNDGKLYNSAAVLHRGELLGRYRKWYPAIHRSVYSAGHEQLVFKLPDFTFGVLICRDSMFSEPARAMAAQGASIFFVPTNTGLPPGRASLELVEETRACDVSRAIENHAYVVRADMAGKDAPLVAFSTTAITGPDGCLVRTAHQDAEELLVTEIM